MRNSCQTSSLIRLVLSLPLLAALFGSGTLSPLIGWSRLYVPSLTETLAMLEVNTSQLECAAAFLLMCLHFPVYRRGLLGLRRHLPGADTLVSAATLASFFTGALPLALNHASGLFIESPIFSSVVSALIAFGAMSHEVPSYFQLTGLFLTFAALGDALYARALVLTAREHADALFAEPLHFGSLPIHAAIVAAILPFIIGLAWIILGVSVPFALAFAVFSLIASAPGTISLAASLPLWIVSVLFGEKGVFVHDFKALEAAAEIDTLVLGKNAILAKGEPYITDVIPEGILPVTLLSYAAAAESQSRHPIAKAISERAIRMRARYGRIAALSESPGEGVEAIMNGTTIRVGRREWLLAQGVRISANLLTKDDQLSEHGKTVLYVSSGTSASGIIAYEYDLADNLPETIRTLKNQGVETILMTGENPRTTKAFAKALGVASFRHGIHGDELAKEIQLLQAHGKHVALFDALAKDSAPMRQADLALLIAAEEPQPVRMLTETERKAEAMKKAAPADSEETAKTETAATASPESTPAVTAITLSGSAALPLLRRLAGTVVSVVRQNHIAAFFGPLVGLVASSGILCILGGPLPAPWMPALASLPGLFAVLANAVRMIKDDNDGDKKETNETKG
ncbi:MAG: cation-translocating P-type ATPase [Schwartzia sp.]|nr:cation-translocating P-type ATPase [Schwartzia sp. (in: firmicutes)]